jgi:hypothetical protein
MQESWIKKEHQMRLELTRRELEYRHMLEEQFIKEGTATTDEERAKLKADHEQERKKFADETADKLKNYDTYRERAEFDMQQKNRRDALNTRHRNETSALTHQFTTRKTKQDSDIEHYYANKLDALERNIRKRDAAKKLRDDIEDRLITFRTAEDNAAYDRRSAQQNLDKQLRTGLINARSGMDRIKAIDDHRRDSQVLAQTHQIEEATRAAIEKAKYEGADEQEINRIQRDSDEMIKLLEDQNEIAKNTRDRLGDGTGGLRGLIQQETGSTEDMMSAWERIQQSAFSHISDPAADAVINMDRNEAIRFAQQMNFYKEWMPKLANINIGLAPDT